MKQWEADIQDIIKELNCELVPEAYKRHREEIFSAIQIICSCAWMAREYGLMYFDTAFARPELYENCGESMEEVFECEIPLKELLLHGLELMANGYEQELAAKLMVQNALVNRYTGWQVYIACVYLKGILMIWAGTPPKEIETYFRTMLPKAEQEAYDEFCELWKNSKQRGGFYGNENSDLPG